MSVFTMTEKTRRGWAFALIAVAWLGATLVVVRQLAPKADKNTAARRTLLARHEEAIAEQQALQDRAAALFEEIQTTPFQIYQMYVVTELREKINGIYEKGSRVESHSLRISKILLLLLNAREELVTKQRNLVKVAAQVQNCREGNQDIQLD